MSLHREDELNRQILNKQRKITGLERKVVELERKVKSLKAANKKTAESENKRYEALFVTYIKVCERNVDMEEKINDLYNELTRQMRLHEAQK